MAPVSVPFAPPSMTDPPSSLDVFSSQPTVPRAALGLAPAPDELVDWQRVFQEFLAVKQQCGESTTSLTFDKFQGTLQRNKDALVGRHGCSRVRFTVYVKEGKAALKASPVK